MAEKATAELFHLDALEGVRQLPDNHFSLIITSPPYNIGKIYEKDNDLSLHDYVRWQSKIVRQLVRKLRPDGSICWQVGSYVKNGEVYPLDAYFYDIFKSLNLRLRNRIIWRFNFGLNSTKRFSGRYETLLWFTKTDNYKFRLDPVRIPQIYPGKRHSKGDKAGLPSGNPLGKNPSDYWEFSAAEAFLEDPVWDIPNVKAKHPEKTSHPCQFPIELVERCVLALTDVGDLVLDPFVGSGASIIAALKHGRGAVGIEKDGAYVDLAKRRIEMLHRGELTMREMGRPTHRPTGTEKVAQVPREWLNG